eukprot:1224571-Prorocentrum_lima.AAC.1
MLDLVYADNIDDALKDGRSTVHFNAAVARTCSLKEADKNPKAKAALDKEWERPVSYTHLRAHETRRHL